MRVTVPSGGLDNEPRSEQSPALGQHLDWAIRTGAFCSYRPKG
jgi:hypothetical protein